MLCHCSISLSLPSRLTNPPVSIAPHPSGITSVVTNSRSSSARLFFPFPYTLRSGNKISMETNHRLPRRTSPFLIRLPGRTTLPSFPVATRFGHTLFRCGVCHPLLHSPSYVAAYPSCLSLCMPLVCCHVPVASQLASLPTSPDLEWVCWR